MSKASTLIGLVISGCVSAAGFIIGIFFSQNFDAQNGASAAPHYPGVDVMVNTVVRAWVILAFAGGVIGLIVFIYLVKNLIKINKIY